MIFGIPSVVYFDQLLLWSCRFSVEIWKETEKQKNERFRANVEIKYHNVTMGMNRADNKNHEAINTIRNANICHQFLH